MSSKLFGIYFSAVSLKHYKTSSRFCYLEFPNFMIGRFYYFGLLPFFFPVGLFLYFLPNVGEELVTKILCFPFFFICFSVSLLNLSLPPFFFFFSCFPLLLFAFTKVTKSACSHECSYHPLELAVPSSL